MAVAGASAGEGSRATPDRRRRVRRQSGTTHPGASRAAQTIVAVTGLARATLVAPR